MDEKVVYGLLLSKDGDKKEISISEISEMYNVRSFERDCIKRAIEILSSRGLLSRIDSDTYRFNGNHKTLLRAIQCDYTNSDERLGDNNEYTSVDDILQSEWKFAPLNVDDDDDDNDDELFSRPPLRRSYTTLNKVISDLKDDDSDQEQDDEDDDAADDEKFETILTKKTDELLATIGNETMEENTSTNLDPCNEKEKKDGHEGLNFDISNEEFEQRCMDIIEKIVSIDHRLTRTQAVDIARKMVSAAKEKQLSKIIVSMYERVEKEFVVATDEEFKLLQAQIFNE